MSKSSGVYKMNTRVNEDQCDISNKDNANTTIFNYSMFNNYETNKNLEKECKDNFNKVSEFSINNHMMMKDGYGMTNACRVDSDSELRNDFEMYDKGKQQLFTRVFTGGPNVNKGGIDTTVDSKVTQGNFTTKNDFCNILVEKSYDRFEPMNKKILASFQNPKNIIPEWTWGGDGTRDVLSQKDFLENNGYEFNGSSWEKKC